MKKSGFFCPFDRFIRMSVLSTRMLPFPCSTVTSPCNFMSAMCMMSLLSFSQFRISSPINNNIGDGRKVHVQLDDETKCWPAGEGRVAVVAPWHGGGGADPSFDVATYFAAGAQFLASQVGRNPPATALTHATSNSHSPIAPRPPLPREVLGSRCGAGSHGRQASSRLSERVRGSGDRGRKE